MKCHPVNALTQDLRGTDWKSDFKDMIYAFCLEQSSVLLYTFHPPFCCLGRLMPRKCLSGWYSNYQAFQPLMHHFDCQKTRYIPKYCILKANPLYVTSYDTGDIKTLRDYKHSPQVLLCSARHFLFAKTLADLCHLGLCKEVYVYIMGQDITHWSCSSHE